MKRLPHVPRLPILLAFEAAIILREHWRLLDDDERRRLIQLVGRSKGLPHRHLDPGERDELIALVQRLELLRAARRIAPLGWLPVPGLPRGSKKRKRG